MSQGSHGRVHVSLQGVSDPKWGHYKIGAFSALELIVKY